MQIVKGIAANVVAIPVTFVIVLIELAKLAYAAGAYAADILYDGIRHGEWYV